MMRERPAQTRIAERLGLVEIQGRKLLARNLAEQTRIYTCHRLSRCTCARRTVGRLCASE